MVNIPSSSHTPRNKQIELRNKVGLTELKQHLYVFLKWVRTNRYLDENQVGVWGWSYGGYLTLKILSRNFRRFWKGPKVGVSIAPVIDWGQYDAIYTERYITDEKTCNRTNPEYSKLLNKKFLLIHGKADDNVHIQSSEILADKLASNPNFTSWFLVDDNHSLSLGNNKELLWNKLVDYFSENL